MAQDKDIAISVKNVHKHFKLPHERKDSIKQRILSPGKQTYEVFRALQDIDFEVRRGEFFGIVGRNGSGKSTLLKTIGGIYLPSKGSVQVNGTLTPFIELGIGFNPELTGRENIFLNGAILGLTRKEIKDKYDDIVEFAELEKFMDQKLKNYSSGMQVRLAFAIAIQAHNDILLIDEVLAVGDAAFQRKCYRVFKNMKNQGKTIIFVTHDMGAVQEYCDRALMIEDSKVLMIGKPREVALHYEVANRESQGNTVAKSARPKNPKVKIDNLHVKDSEQKKATFTQADKLIVELDFSVVEALAVQFNMFVTRLDGTYIAGVNTTTDLKEFTPKKGTHTITCVIDAGQLPKGEYQINAAAYTYCSWPSTEVPELIDIFDASYGSKVPYVQIEDASRYQDGEFYMKAKWSS